MPTQQIPNWGHDFQKSFRDLRELYAFLGWEWQTELSQVAQKFPVFIPQSLAEKIKIQGKSGVLAREFLPDLLELDHDLNKHGFEDPIGDKAFNKAPQLIHRYSSRALFTETNICPVLCRYCFRKNELNAQDDLFHKSFGKTLSYLEAHSEITEIIFTGGDPLTLSNDLLDKMLESFSTIKHIKDKMSRIRYVMDMVDLGLGILARRKKLKMTQAALASTNGMSRATISYLENGRLPELGIRKIIAICETLGLELELKEASSRPTLRDLIKEKNRA